jgi:hypothetical protein
LSPWLRTSRSSSKGPAGRQKKARRTGEGKREGCIGSLLLSRTLMYFSICLLLSVDPQQFGSTVGSHLTRPVKFSQVERVVKTCVGAPTRFNKVHVKNKIPINASPSIHLLVPLGLGYRINDDTPRTLPPPFLFPKPTPRLLSYGCRNTKERG